VSRAILAAGGFGPYANKKKVTITRANSANTNLTSKIMVDLTEIWDKGRFNKDEKLEPGDWINVPSTIFRFK
jgi:protein involved in polysaccharide export with SLBB domain